ncbi:hypothetical protein GCM10009120_14440 [Sphingobacterium siyangense subsp. cladoniae]
MLTGFGLRSKSKVVRLVGRTVVHFFKNVVQKLTAIHNFHSGTAFVAFASNDNYEKLERKVYTLQV